MCSFHQLVDELLVKVSLYLFIFLILFPVSGGMYYTTHSEHFLSLAVDFCRTSESSCWVKIPVLQDDQLLDKHYIFLCTDHTSTHFKKDFDWQDLAEALPCFSKKKKKNAAQIHPQLPSGLKHSSLSCGECWLSTVQGWWSLSRRQPPGPGPSLHSEGSSHSQ